MSNLLHTFAKNDPPKILHFYISSSFPLTFSPFLSVENRGREGRELAKHWKPDKEKNFCHLCRKVKNGYKPPLNDIECFS